MADVGCPGWRWEDEEEVEVVVEEASRYRCGAGGYAGWREASHIGAGRGLRDWSKRSVAGADKKLHPKKVSPSPLRTPNHTGPTVRQPLPARPASPASQPNLGYTLFLPTNPFAPRNTENCSETNSTYLPLSSHLPRPPPFLPAAVSRGDDVPTIKALARKTRGPRGSRRNAIIIYRD